MLQQLVDSGQDRGSGHLTGGERPAAGVPQAEEGAAQSQQQRPARDVCTRLRQLWRRHQGQAQAIQHHHGSQGTPHSP